MVEPGLFRRLLDDAGIIHYGDMIEWDDDNLYPFYDGFVAGDDIMPVWERFRDDDADADIVDFVRQLYADEFTEYLFAALAAEKYGFL